MSPSGSPERVGAHELSAALITPLWSVSGVHPLVSLIEETVLPPLEVLGSYVIVPWPCMHRFISGRPSVPSICVSVPASTELFSLLSLYGPVWNQGA